MPIRGFDHAAMPADDVATLIPFYRRLGFAVVGEEAWREGRALVIVFAFGDSKINVHAPELWRNPRFTLRGPSAQPGCGDYCFVWDGGLDALHAMLAEAGAEVIEGPVTRVGGRATGTAEGTSLYIRDPEGNLLEFIVYADVTAT
ncbi:MAG: VOC family virulence protein [Chloroflexi bacterium]|nr:VOC family virulence protein [Chloroflexota bacterium]MDA1003977.1 VOC family virulence protein [Chloroflexota bacterium]